MQCELLKLIMDARWAGNEYVSTRLANNSAFYIELWSQTLRLLRGFSLWQKTVDANKPGHWLYYILAELPEHFLVFNKYLKGNITSSISIVIGMPNMHSLKIACKIMAINSNELLTARIQVTALNAWYFLTRSIQCAERKAETSNASIHAQDDR